MLKNNKLKLKIIEFQRHSNEIVRKIKNILLKIDVDNIKEKEMIYYNNGDTYEGKYINDKKEGKEYIIIMMVISMKGIG